MMRAFVFPGLTTRVVFGSGTLKRAGAELELLGHERALILTTPGRRSEALAEALAADLGPRAAGIFAGAVQHTPVEATGRALKALDASGAGAVVSLGGGSTIGLGKALAARTGADQIAVPTTYAGSETTDILGETSDGEKTTCRGPEIRPETVIYDVDLTLGLPVPISLASAMNAMAHGMEALYAPDRNPVILALCREAFAAFRESLPRLTEAPRDPEARSQALYAAWCCSTALGQVSMALHHKLAHVLGGAFGTPHAETHAALLPYATAFNEAAVPELLAPLAAAFGADSAGGALWDFSERLGAPLGLKGLGLAEADLDRAADLAVAKPYPNPRPFDRAAIRALLQAAWEGRRPVAA